MNKEILICGEIEDGIIQPATLELLGLGRTLANDLGCTLSVLFLGGPVPDICTGVFHYGADKLCLVNAAELSQYNPEWYTSAVTQACRQIDPSLILFSHNTLGRDIAARVAYRLGIVAGTDCIGLHIDPETRSLIRTRMVYGGNAVAASASPDSALQLVSLRPGMFPVPVPDTSRQGETVELKVDLDTSAVKTRLAVTTRRTSDGIRLEDADVIVAGGGGIGDPEGFQLLEALASVWHGAVGTTRVPCDEGWVPTKKSEIGISGKTVKPSLYFAVGIRGASQHIAGCSESRCIVTINTDPDAPMFRYSDYGIVGDYRQIVPALIEECKKIRQH